MYLCKQSEPKEGRRAASLVMCMCNIQDNFGPGARSNTLLACKQAYLMHIKYQTGQVIDPWARVKSKTCAPRPWEDLQNSCTLQPQPAQKQGERSRSGMRMMRAHISQLRATVGRKAKTRRHSVQLGVDSIIYPGVSCSHNVTGCFQTNATQDNSCIAGPAPVHVFFMLGNARLLALHHEMATRICHQ